MYTLDSNLLDIPNYTGEELDRFLRATQDRYRQPVPMIGTGAAFVEAGNRHGVNPLFLLALGICESAWGRSNLSQPPRHNLFGLNAVDSNPELAWHYPSYAAAIDFAASFLKNSYLLPRNGRTYQLPNGWVWTVGYHYGGASSLRGVFTSELLPAKAPRYSTAGINEARTLETLMNQVLTFLGAPIPTGVGGPVDPQVDVPQPVTYQDTYTVQRGDSLWAIAEKLYGNGSQWYVLAQANGIANPRSLGAGVVLRIPRRDSGVQPSTPSSPSVPHPTERTYTVQAHDRIGGLWGIAKTQLGDGARWQEIAQLNNLSNPSQIHVGNVLRLPS